MSRWVNKVAQQTGSEDQAQPAQQTDTQPTPNQQTAQHKEPGFFEKAEDVYNEHVSPWVSRGQGFVRDNARALQGRIGDTKGLGEYDIRNLAHKGLGWVADNPGASLFGAGALGLGGLYMMGRRKKRRREDEY